MSSRKPYTGSHRRLVVGIDVGTTFSGVSYAILDPGVVPIIQGVNRYPAQESVGGDAKIPSIIYYDSARSVRAVGAEALLESNAELAIEEQWVKAEWFKLYLRPKHTIASTDDHLLPLPLGKTVEQVYGDFLRYLYQCTKGYIQETHADGVKLMTSITSQVHFILTHPNGWSSLQQAQMRKAAIHAGLVPDTPDGHSRIQFVAEGEASLHFCIGSHNGSEIIQSGKSFIIVDAGSSTIDLSAYRLKEAPNLYEEIAPAICHFEGSVFVSRRARKFLEEKLSMSRYSSPDDISHITECFDQTTKMAFKDASQPSYIKFGSSRDTDASVNIKLGLLKLLGSDVATFYEPSIAIIKQAIQEMKTAAFVPVTTVILIGEFAASVWLLSNLQTHLRTIGLRFFRPDGHLSKAFADGAVSFHLDHLVTTHVPRTTFGVNMNIESNKYDEEHRRRSHIPGSSLSFTIAPRSPYTGSHRRLVVGIDVGTTFSGVSYSILDPDVIPIIQGVNRYPGQERVGGDSKIPSIIYYDSAGSVRAVGAEALLESNAELAREEQWVKAEWLKLYLRPGHTNISTDENLPPLPFGKTVEQVYGDFLRYLYQCTEEYIRETHASGVELLTSFRSQVHFILTHPNTWEGRQQAQMRRAAIHAGLVPDTPDGHSRIQFVTEGEASLHFCIGSRYVLDIIKSGEGFIIVDAGGGTIDLSTYYLKEAPNVFEEVAPATCYFQGSVFVSRRARKFLESLLYKSRYSDDISLITECFDKTTKLAFKDSSQPSYIKFGTSRDTDASVNIKFGLLKLLGSDVATLFEPSIATIKQAIQEQKTTALVPVTSVLLVGGFAASNWLFSNLQTRLRTTGLRFVRPDGHLGKAVADGAVSFHLDHFVTARVARTTFGVECKLLYNENDQEHRRRSRTVIINAAGERRIPKCYDVILAKGTRVSETTVFRRPYLRYISKQSDLTTVTLDIFSYRGNHPKPQWTDVDPHLYSTVCKVTADVEHIIRTLPRLIGKHGKPYYRFDYEIELLFGLVEHKARICWEENGVKKRGPAEIVYDHAIGLA